MLLLSGPALVICRPSRPSYNSIKIFVFVMAAFVSSKQSVIIPWMLLRVHSLHINTNGWTCVTVHRSPQKFPHLVQAIDRRYASWGSRSEEACLVALGTSKLFPRRRQMSIWETYIFSPLLATSKYHEFRYMPSESAASECKVNTQLDIVRWLQ